MSLSVCEGFLFDYLIFFKPRGKTIIFLMLIWFPNGKNVLGKYGHYAYVMKMWVDNPLNIGYRPSVFTYAICLPLCTRVGVMDAPLSRLPRNTSIQILSLDFGIQL